MRCLTNQRSSREALGLSLETHRSGWLPHQGDSPLRWEMEGTSCHVSESRCSGLRATPSQSQQGKETLPVLYKELDSARNKPEISKPDLNLWRTQPCEAVLALLTLGTMDVAVSWWDYIFFCYGRKQIHRTMKKKPKYIKIQHTMVILPKCHCLLECFI